jgi:hypothetical protein
VAITTPLLLYLLYPPFPAKCELDVPKKVAAEFLQAAIIEATENGPQFQMSALSVSARQVERKKGEV